MTDSDKWRGRGGRPVLLPTLSPSKTQHPLEPLLPNRKPLTLLGQVVREADAAFRSAANTVTFGKADQYAAAANAAFGVGGPVPLSDRYRRNLMVEHARDNADAYLRPFGHGLGEVLGVGLLARLGGRAGVLASQGSPSLVKGALGEAFSLAKTIGKGDFPRAVQVRRPLKVRWTELDHETFGGENVEAKFGRSADLTPAQRRAAKELPRYRVDWWLPEDVGRVTGPAAATTGAIGSVRSDQQGW